MLSRGISPAAALSCAAVMLMPVVVHADATAAARKAIEAAYQKESAAFARKDINAALANCAPDFTETDSNGRKQTLAQIRQMAPMIFGQMKTINEKKTITKFSLKGKQATVTAKDHVILTAANPQTKKDVKIVVDEVGEDIWINNGKSWLRKSSKTLSQKQTVDGKPVPGR